MHLFGVLWLGLGLAGMLLVSPVVALVTLVILAAGGGWRVSTDAFHGCHSLLHYSGFPGRVGVADIGTQPSG